MRDANWFQSPTKKQLGLFVAIWFLGFGLLSAAMTDLFWETPFQGKYLSLYFLILFSLLALARLIANYNRNRGRKRPSGL